MTETERITIRFFQGILDGGQISFAFPRDRLIAGDHYCHDDNGRRYCYLISSVMQSQDLEGECKEATAHLERCYVI